MLLKGQSSTVRRLKFRHRLTSNLEPPPSTSIRYTRHVLGQDTIRLRSALMSRLNQTDSAENSADTPTAKDIGCNQLLGHLNDTPKKFDDKPADFELTVH